MRLRKENRNLLSMARKTHRSDNPLDGLFPVFSIFAGREGHPPETRITQKRVGDLLSSQVVTILMVMMIA